MWNSSSKKQCENFRRIVRLSKCTDASNELVRGYSPSYTGVLTKAGFTSAAAILAIPLSVFVSRVQDGIPAKDATAIYDHAANTYECRTITSYEAVQGTGLAAIEGNISTRERIEMVNQTGETLADLGLAHFFGDMDRDVCDDCNSFTSPAAYLVEILQFLRSNSPNSVLGLPEQEKNFGTALECLFARRPDLSKLELTCTNTKTTLPYLDLANEIMESFVVYLWEHLNPPGALKEDVIRAHKDPSPICGDLLSESQEMNDEAYAIISESMSPFNILPYHQPLDEIRTFLAYLKTSRYELLDHCRRAFQSGTIVEEDGEAAGSVEVHDAAQKRAITAEYLGLTEAEYIALTGEDYLQNKYDSIEGDESPIEKAGGPVRKRTWWEYWGYKKKDDALQVDTGPEVIKTEFLRRSGMQSSELVGLLKTEFVNPHVPRGNGLAILESNDFGFVSLSEILSQGVGIEDPVLRYQSLIEYMDAQQIKSTSISKTGKFSRKQIEDWVKMNSETFSKLIVLDNPHMSEGWHPSHARLTHLNGGRLDPEEFMRIQQFLRLRAKMGWTIDELDKAISGLSQPKAEGAEQNTPSTPLITADLLDQLVCVAKILNMTDLELPKLLTFWSTISTRGENCLYAQLFLTHDHIIIDPLFKPDDEGNYFTELGKLSAHTTVVMAALGLTKDGVYALMDENPYFETSFDEQDLSTEGLSLLYRYSLMAKTLRITPATMCQVVQVFGNIFESPSHTLEFLEHWGRMGEAGISFAQLNYVLRGVNDPLNPLGPSQPKILATIKLLLDGIEIINTTHPDIKDEEHDALTKDDLTAKLSLLYDDSQVRQVHEFLESTPEWVAAKPPNWLKLTFDFIKDDDEVTLSSAETSIMKKRFVFLNGFLPYLREELIEHLVITTMSREVGIPTEMMRILLSDILSIEVEERDENKVSALKAIGNIPLRSKYQDIAGFEGYLFPSSSNIYTFISPNTKIPTLQVDEICVPFSNEDLLSTNPIYLEGGQPYPFVVTDDTDHSLQWKTHASPIHSIPGVTLLPRSAEKLVARIFVQLAKIAIIVNSCNLSTDEIKYMTKYPQDSPIFGGGVLLFTGWSQLLSYLDFRNSLPNIPSKELVHLFWWASNPEVTELHPAGKTLSERIASIMLAKESEIKKLLAHFGLDKQGSFIDWEKFTKLKKAYDLARKVSVDVDSLFTWAEPLVDFGKARKIAQEIHGSTRSRYTTKDWGVVIKPLRHHLRRNQRDALIRYLLNQTEVVEWGVVDVDSLFGFFLIDVQMGPCLETSRIKQAISTVQLFIQRCMSGQEEKYGVPIRTLDRKRWEWIKDYHIWEANRKVIVYPENWIEPSLRDDKSPIFQEFENDILQKDLDPRSIQDAIKKYLSNIDEVANLHVVSVYSDTETKIVHIFARSRGAPYFYYYRTYHPIEWVWKPWEKMQVDIPHYEDNDVNSANHGGAFLKPVVWMGRLIVFIPWFTKQAGREKDSEVENTGNMYQLHEKSPPLPTPQSTHYECWELKVGWTEYRNGKWTPKQLTSKSFRTESGPGGVGTLRECVFTTSFCNDDLYLTAQIEARRTAWFRLSRGQFDAVEATDLLSHEYAAAVPCINSSKPGIHREFGTVVDKDNIYVSTVDPSINLSNVDISPSTIDYNRRNPTTTVFSAQPDYTTQFYHEFSSHLLRHTSTSSTLDDLYKGFGSEVLRFKHNALGYSGFPPGLNGMNYPNYHELKSPYALYNWELGLHIPMLLMDKLRSCHQYEEALKIAHHVFDPMSHHLDENANYYSKDDGGRSEIDYPKKSCTWKWTPFKEISAQNVLSRLLDGLKANAPDKPGGQINGLRDAPSHPHVIARSRPVAYMKWFVMTYINILVDCGDQYFRQNTSDSVSLAIQYYTLAAHLYGPLRRKTRRRGKKNPETYESLVKRLNIVNDTTANCKTTSPFGHHTAMIATTSSTTASSPLGMMPLYFSVPENDKIIDLRTKIDDRLYKLRHCQDIRGNTCKLDLLVPKIDTAALVQAAAQGLSHYNIQQGLNAPMPNYRFRYILVKAFEVVQELKSLGNAFLKAMAKKDSESYHLIRAGYQSSINEMILSMKELSLEEANKALVSLEEARKGPVCRLQHFYKLIGENERRPPSEIEDYQELTGPTVMTVHDSGYRLTAFEVAEVGKAEGATEYIEKRNTAETSSAVLLSLPTMSTSTMPLGMGLSMGFRALNLGQAASAYSHSMTSQMDLLQSQAIGAARKNSLLRQYQNRVQQANSAGYEIKHIDKQIETQKTRIKITKRDIELQQRRLQFIVDTEKFLRTKYTNEDLYMWREKQLRDLYYQTYLLAYDLAKKAENSFQFERGPVNSYHFERGPAITNFIQGTWNANKDGLFSGEGLYLGLKRLEVAYNENRGYDYEITKHFSLRQLNPIALIEFRELGNCEFDLPEVLFDMDFPGHYKRRIKGVSLTIKAAALSAAPGRSSMASVNMTSVNCTMRLVRHSYRVKVATDENSYAEGWDNKADDSFHTDVIPIDHIATSNAQNDSGTFKPTTIDERYAPFEGAGAISRWKIELPNNYRMFDYRSIADATVHLRYTSVYGGDTLKSVASGYVDSYMKEIKSSKGGMFALFDPKSEFSAEWKEFKTSNSLKMPNLDDILPFVANKYSNKITVKEILLFTSANVEPTKLKMAVGLPSSPKDVLFSPYESRCLKAFSSGENVDCSFGTWTLEFTKSGKDSIRDLLVVVHYTLVRR